MNSGEVPRPDPRRIAPFETMGARDAQVDSRLWDRHLERLARNAARAGLALELPAELRAAAAELLLQSNHGDGILRLALLPVGDAVHVAMTSRLKSPAHSVLLLPTVVERQGDLPPPDVKAAPRTFYDAVLQQAQDGGADDGIVVDRDGGVLETALSNLWLRLDGGWVTPPLDGRVLPGIARAVLLEHGSSHGLRERAIDLADLHRAEAIAVSNAVYGPRAAGLVGHGRPEVDLVRSELGGFWL
ncbi:MAG: aminotransferase class IV [Planctomycetes bacterium]|nr:aminotransferase class IV [Planctomycetota bacterium]